MFNFTGKSVAVVGSSGHLLERDYASSIDSHDIVIRFNQARVEGYEEFVGNRTDYRIVNVHTFLGTTGKSRFPANNPNFIPSLPAQHIIVNRPIPTSSIEKRSPNNQVSILSDEFWKSCEDLLMNRKQPSVGFLGIILAVNTADRVSVYGFDQEHTVEKKHYWEDVKGLGDWHSFSAEKEYTSKLEKTNKITIFN